MKQKKSGIRHQIVEGCFETLEKARMSVGRNGNDRQELLIRVSRSGGTSARFPLLTKIEHSN